MSWLRPGMGLMYRRYSLDWDINEHVTISQVTDLQVIVKVRRRYISGWSLYPFHDRHLQTMTYIVDRQTGKAIDDETHPFYRRLWLNPLFTIGDNIPVSIRLENPTDLLFTVTGQDMKTVDMNHFNCWRLDASFKDEHYRIWYDHHYGIRIRFEAMKPISQHQFSAYTVWELQQAYMN